MRPLFPGSSTSVQVVGAWPGHGTGVVSVDPAGRAFLRPAPPGPGGSSPGGGCDGRDGTGQSLWISPGWVDLHAHVYDAVTPISVAPDAVGLVHGVHLLADAGSAGEATIAGLARWVVPAARTPVVAWLNIGSHGLVHLRETADASFIDVNATIRAVQAHPDLIRGIKVRSSGAIVGNMGRQPLQLARLVARHCGLPLLVHIGEAPPLIEDVLDLLDDGDTITHCFHGKTGRPWRPDGHPVPALRRALERGVRLDVGHGAASLDIQVAGAAVAQGWLPHTVSTDIHVRNIAGPVFDLATVMTKLLHCGMGLPALIDAVTTAPRATLGLPDPWLDADGRIRHATVFTVDPAAPAGRHYVDSVGHTISPQRHIVVRGVVVGGQARGLEDQAPR